MPVAIPIDYSQFVLYFLIIAIVLLTGKIVKRWWCSYKVEYVLHDLLKEQTIVEKKKKAF